MPYDNLHKLIDDEDDKDDDDLDDEGDNFDEEDGDRGDFDAYGNPKESTADSVSSSHLDKDLPAGSSVDGGGRRDKSVRRKGKSDNSEVKVFHFTLDGLFGQSEREEEEGDGESTGKSSRGKVLISSLLEQLMVSHG